MYSRKRYGESRVNNCPFCSRQGVTKNAQGVPTCLSHKNDALSDLKCACGSYVDVKSGKWGAYASCLRCGNVNLRKVLEINPQQKEQETPQKKMPEERKDVTVRSDELDFLY
jgi:hypothetical protein